MALDRGRLAETAAPAASDLFLWRRAEEEEVRGKQTEQPTEGAAEGLRRVLAVVRQDAGATRMLQGGEHFRLTMSTGLAHSGQATHNIFLEIRVELESIWHQAPQISTIA